jgi:hypothetical protein
LKCKKASKKEGMKRMMICFANGGRRIGRITGWNNILTQSGIKDPIKRPLHLMSYRN